MLFQSGSMATRKGALLLITICVARFMFVEGQGTCCRKKTFRAWCDTNGEQEQDLCAHCEAYDSYNCARTHCYYYDCLCTGGCLDDDWNLEKTANCQKKVNKLFCESEVAPEGRGGGNGTAAEQELYNSIEELFKLIDKNGDGVTDANEMREFAKAKDGEAAAAKEVKEILENWGKDENGQLTLDEVKKGPKK